MFFFFWFCYSWFGMCVDFHSYDCFVNMSILIFILFHMSNQNAKVLAYHWHRALSFSYFIVFFLVWIEIVLYTKARASMHLILLFSYRDTYLLSQLLNAFVYLIVFISYVFHHYKMYQKEKKVEKSMTNPNRRFNL